MIWQLDQQSKEVVSPGRHKPTPVSAAGSCKMSPYYLFAAKAEGCVVSQTFGKDSEWDSEGGNVLNTVERWSSDYMGFSLQRWRYIERVNEGRSERPRGLWHTDHLVSPRALNCTLQLQYITFLLSAWMQPTASLFNILRAFCYFTQAAKFYLQPAVLEKRIFMMFPHFKRRKYDATCWALCGPDAVWMTHSLHCGLLFWPLQWDGLSTEVCAINGSKPTWMLWWKRETCNRRGKPGARETAFLFVHSADLDPFIPAPSHCLHRVIILWIPAVWPINRCI